MAVSCGIVGLPNVGKSTLFSALSAAKAEIGNYPFCTIEPNVAVVEVPDERLELIRRHIESQKIIPAAVQVVDIAGLVKGASEGEGMGNKFLATIRECDAVMQVVRCFGGDRVVREGAVDPVGDAEIIELELALADLDTVRKAVERTGKKARSGEKEAVETQEVCAKAAALLERGLPVRAGDWTAREAAALKPICLMTMKPMLYVANVADSDLDGSGPLAQALAAHARKHGCGFIPICADLEIALREMPAEDRAGFMEELGMKEMGLPRLVRSIYELLGLQTYFTAGPKEIRAWTIHRGWKAPQAAGVIHTDFEKHFIRAEIYSVRDLAELGTEAAIRAAGRMRTEGRDYVMQDEDVTHFLIGK